MDIEHEVCQSSLQLCPHAAVNREPGPGNLPGALEIQDAQGRAQVPMRLRFKVELARLAPTPNLLVVLRAPADGNARMRHIRNVAQEFLELFVVPLGLIIKLLDLRAHLFHLGNQGRGIPLRLFQSGDFLGSLIATRLARFRLEQEFAPFTVNGFKASERILHPALAHFLLHKLQIVTDKTQIEHFDSS